MEKNIPENKEISNYTVSISEGDSGRLDKFLSEKIEGLTRTKIKNLMESGQISLNGKKFENASHKIKAGEVYTILIPPPEPSTMQAKDIPLDIVYEDKYLLVINKQAGLTVHPGAGNHSDTLVNALLSHCKGSLSGIGGVERPGIVHRLDRETSGLMVVAKTDAAHLDLSNQIRERTLKRTYNALVFGIPNPLAGSIKTNISRSKINRKKMAVYDDDGKESITHYKLLEAFAAGSLSLVECSLQTGRTHQIRVHMTHIGHPLVGDKTYGNSRNRKLTNLNSETKKMIGNFARQALHSRKIAFTHPESHKLLEFESKLPADIDALVQELKRC